MLALITGASGQLGQSLLMQKNHQHELIAFNRDQLDITNFDRLTDVFEKSKPDVLINLAAYTNVDKAETEIDLAFAVNAIAVKNLAQLTNQYEIPIIHLSTDYVFSGDKGSPYLESDTPNPVNVYGKSKLAGEVAIRECNPKHIILRSSWIFSDKGKIFLNTILQMAKQQKTISVVNDQIGGPTSAGDLASFLIKPLNQLPAFADNDWGGVPLLRCALCFLV
jgi:dTDP-4-dehydrorhamnose reductase